MDENYRKNLKDELKDIRDKKFELDEQMEELKVFRNPNLFFNYIRNPKLFLERKGLKDELNYKKDSLNPVSNQLRKQYRSAFSHIENYDLIRKQENLNSRIDDLDRRYNKIESMKKDSLLFKLSPENRRINNLLRKIDHEKSNQEEFRDDTLNEIWKRGICLEVYYTQKGFIKN